jgi:hypothetical protein
VTARKATGRFFILYIRGDIKAFFIVSLNNFDILSFNLMSLLAYFLRRVRHRWQMIVLLFLSVGLATGLLASGPVLADTVIGFALPYKLRSSSPLSSNLRLTTYDLVDPTAYQMLDEQVQGGVQRRLGAYGENVLGGGSTNWMFPWYLEQLVADQRVNLRFYADLDAHIEWVAGGWPGEAVLSGDVIYAAVGELLAEAYELQVGERLPLSRNDRESEPSLWLEVTGILKAHNAQEVYWFGEFSPLTVRADNQYSAEYSALLPEAALLEVQREIFPGARSEMTWNVLLDPARVQVEDIPELRAQAAALRTELRDQTPTIATETRLDELLGSFIDQAWVVRITLYVLIVEILFLALYYLGMVASLSVQQVEGEFANLASRGGSLGQIFRLQAVEAGLVCLLALLAGPGLAQLIVWGLAKAGPIAAVSQADWIVRLPGAAWLAAGLGALVGVGGLLIPVRQAVGHSVVSYTQQRSRPERVPWWQRLYLDMLAAAGALLLVWRLHSYGSLANLAGVPGQVDWLLLVAPLALLVSSAVIVLRIFPLLLRVLSQLAAAGRGLPAALAMWYSTRNPAHVARLILLLTLTMALGILSNGLETTLNAIEYERASYASGADLRMFFDRYRSLVDTTTLAGVTAVSPVWRGSGSVNIRSYRSFPSFDLLAIEPFSFSKVSRYRYDYADQPMGGLLGKLDVEEDEDANPQLYLPGHPARFGIWMLDRKSRFSEARLVNHIYFQAKIQSAQGEMLLINLQLTPPSGRAVGDQAPDEEWRYWEASLPELPVESYPLTLHSIWVTVRVSALSEHLSLDFALDDLTVTDRQNGSTSIVEGFEGVERIWQANNAQTVVQFTRQITAHTGSGTLVFRIPFNVARQGLALYLASGMRQTAIPVLASPEFLSVTQLLVGDDFLGYVNSIPTAMIIVGEVQYFPTLYEQPGRGFLITARDPLLTLLNREKRMPANPNELWVGLVEGQAAGEVSQEFPDAIRSMDRQAEQQAIRADPLALGLRSVTLLGTVLTAVLSLAGFATHFYLSARQRETTYSILRSLGLSTGQLYITLVLEQIVMICAGLVLGILLGWVLNQLVLPSLPLSLGDRPPIPPMIPLEDWRAIIRFTLTLAGSFLVILGGSTALLWRSNVHRLMRIGQD